MRKLVAASAATVVLGVALPPAVAPAAPAVAASLKTQLAAAKKSRAAWVRRAQKAEATVRRLRREAASDAALLAAFDVDLASRDAQIATLTAQVGTLTSQNTALRSAVPDQVAAIARAGVPGDLQTFVLTPAHNAWPCRGSVFFGQSFFSYDFNMPGSFGC